MHSNRRLVLRIAAAVPVMSQARAFGAESYPDKPVRLVVPFPPGGSNDVLARVLGEGLTKAWNQPVIVDNRAGAAGNIGADIVAKAAPDGYNLLISPNNLLTMNPALFSKLPFDPIKDFSSISLLGTVPVVLAVNPRLGVKSVGQLIELAKRSKYPLTYGSGGIGSPQHLSAEMFRSLAQVELVHVPYKGATPAISDLLAGQINMFFGAVNSLLPHFSSGRLVPLGVGGTTRIASLPQVPTLSESGVKGYESDIWVGLSAPRGVPKNVIETVNLAARVALGSTDSQTKLRAQGIEPKLGTPESMDHLVQTDLKRWSKIIKEAGVKAD